MCTVIKLITLSHCYGPSFPRFLTEKEVKNIKERKIFFFTTKHHMLRATNVHMLVIYTPALLVTFRRSAQLVSLYYKIKRLVLSVWNIKYVYGKRVCRVMWRGSLIIGATPSSYLNPNFLRKSFPSLPFLSTQKKLSTNIKSNNILFYYEPITINCILWHITFIFMLFIACLSIIF